MKINVKCSVCLQYCEQNLDKLLYRENMPIVCYQCSGHTSSHEEDIKEFLRGINISFESNKKIGRNEIDILINKNIAIEFNGVYWHNELRHPDKDYHLNKTNMCLKRGIDLIHIWEDDWIYRQDIVKSIIKNKLGITTHKIYARKCKISEVLPSEKNIFLEKNHIQGKVNTKINIGLYYENELVSLMTFGYGRNQDFVLSRFCSKLDTNVVGGFSRLLKYFEDNYGKEYTEIKTFADRSISNGKLYETHGFKMVRQTYPDYMYVVGDKRVRKQNFTHKKLVLEGFDPSKSEHEIMLERKIYRIYDCGKLVYIKTVSHADKLDR